ncbi:hypothetical protein [Alteromonas facilis]|uniref:hypothetical protein n=1 Tax=Alteromonas facilis TaxID=2048004 RepID=UPI000C28C56E|nr:hypothetical protein [Alteromonas facilis]
MRKLTLTLCVCSILALTGCVHSGRYHRAQADQFIVEFYAWVDRVEEVEFDSNVDENIAFGAVHGAISGAHIDSHHALRGALWGGMLLGFLTALAEGDNTGYEYQLTAVDGDSVTVLSQRQSALLGDCVIVRVADKVELVAVEAEACASAVM